MSFSHPCPLALLFIECYKGPGPLQSFLHSVFNPQNNTMWRVLLFFSLVEMMKLILTEMVRTEPGCDPNCQPPSSSPQPRLHTEAPPTWPRTFPGNSVCKKYSQASGPLAFCGFISEIKAKCFPLPLKDPCTPPAIPCSLLQAMSVPFLGPHQPAEG